MLKLYTYWRSSAAYRVRIALYHKGLEFESVPVNLIKDGGQQRSEQYRQMNPAALVPMLLDGDFALNQSLAIIDYLEALAPTPSLYPKNLQDKMLVKAMAMDIACEVHPINNLRVLQYLSQEFSADPEVKQAWLQQWMSTGFEALERQLEKYSGQYCFGDQITLVDLCLVPQIYNANRFGVELVDFPLITNIVERCNSLPAFIQAQPEQQPDAV